MGARFIKNSTLKGIADAIRRKRGTSAPLAVSKFATEISRITSGNAPIFDGTIEIDGQPAKDFTDYYEEGKTAGIAEGRQAQHNEFWSTFQREIDNNYARYAGGGWTRETFRPTQDINITGNANYCFAYNECDVDLVEWCESLGINITIRPSSCSSMFQRAAFTRIPTVDFTNVTAISSTFAYCPNLVTIDKAIFKADGSNTFSSAFYELGSLENIIAEGVIGNNGINIRWSPKLSKASITSFINALSPTTSGLSISFHKIAVNTAFETSVGAGDGSTSEEWLALIATKNNWTIGLTQ